MGVTATSQRGSGADDQYIHSLHWGGVLGEGEHDIVVKWRTSNGTFTQEGTKHPRVLTIEEK